MVSTVEMEELLGRLALYGAESPAEGEPTKPALYLTILTVLKDGKANGSSVSRALQNQRGALLPVLVNGEFDVPCAGCWQPL